MAEASITINDIVFVVDCGKAKETTYDALNNTPCLLPSWISQASARQASIYISSIHCCCFYFNFCSVHAATDAPSLLYLPLGAGLSNIFLGKCLYVVYVKIIQPLVEK